MFQRKTRGLNIAGLYKSIGENESAKTYLIQYLSLNPKSPEAHRQLGEILERLGQKEKALASYKTSYEIAEHQKDLVLKSNIYSHEFNIF